MHYINGDYYLPRQHDMFRLVNPATEEITSLIPSSSKEDIDYAVSSARDAFSLWQASSKNDRLSVIGNIKKLYKSYSEEIANAITTEMGCPITLSRTDQVGAAYKRITEALNTLDKFNFEKEVEFKNSINVLRYEPFGVCALITPWNWPMNQLIAKVIPALAAGCCVVLKPSELSPLSAQIFAQIVHESDCPPGVFNLVYGQNDIGRYVASHPDVDLISFTGSSEVGSDIIRSSSINIKKTILELGGKGANIVFADSTESVVSKSIVKCFKNSGQSCKASTRLLVESNIYNDVLDMAYEIVKNIEVNLPEIEGNHIGPVASEKQFVKIQGHIEKATQEGAKILIGGKGRPDGLNAGYFVQPTLLANVDPKIEIAQEEVFGPILSIIPFNNEDDAIAIANGTRYGLANYIQTNDALKARRIATKLRSGVVEINGIARGEGMPFGGYKQSGLGREGGQFGQQEFLEVKSVSGLEKLLN